MRKLWQITIDDYLEVVRRAKERGIETGESMECVFIEYMEEKNRKPLGHTELTDNEILNEMLSHGQNVVDINTNEKGEQELRLYKKKEDEL